MAITDYYRDLKHIKTTETPDDRGGTIITDTEVDIRGCINQASSQQVDYALKLSIEATHKLYYPISVELDINDRVKDGNKVYEVVSEPLNTINRNHHYMVLLKRLII